MTLPEITVDHVHTSTVTGHVAIIMWLHGLNADKSNDLRTGSGLFPGGDAFIPSKENTVLFETQIVSNGIRRTLRELLQKQLLLKYISTFYIAIWSQSM